MSTTAHLWKSEDAGVSWTDIFTFTGPSGTLITDWCFSKFDHNIVYIKWMSHGFWRSVDGGNSYSKQNEGIPW